MDPKELDAHAGEVIRELRTGEGLSQAELAEAMTNAGVPTHAMTVLKIEKGTRPLRLVEAKVLLDVLRANWDVFDPPTSLEELAYEVQDQEQAQASEVRKAVADYIRKWRFLRDTAATYEEHFQDEAREGRTFDEYVPVDYLDRIAELVAYAEDDVRRGRLVGSREELEEFLQALHEREAVVRAELERRRERSADGEHPEAP